ncbi:MAG: hypothetical protein HY909_25370 [Deltaproteobacteria bacterium]|nr:hypothetical protein [Deltaproteobacteria bacterium]
MLLGLKFAKLLAVLALASGSLGAVFARDLEERQRFAYRLAGPGFGATWLLGFLLVNETQRSLLAGWLLGALFLSFVSLQAVLFSVGTEGRRTAATALLVLGPLVGTVALMVWKPG